MIPAQKSYLIAGILLMTQYAYAQESWPSPEAEQIYTHARQYLALGNYKDAVITYKQAILIAPGKVAIYRELGKALYLSGDFTEAKKVLLEIPAKADAGEEYYQLLAACMTAKQEFKTAKATLKTGIEKYPLSGLLYHEAGNLELLEGNPEEALQAWLTGIQKAPGYQRNYYDAANIYLGTNEVMCGLLYGELFLTMEQDTTGADELKRKLFAGYKTMFDNFGGDEVPGFGKTAKALPVNSFGDAVGQIYRGLTPVVSDGATTENLTMVRTRFLMEWFQAYKSKYPFSLFDYQDEMIRTGHFDIYNEWLFGMAESAESYKAWNTFHEGDMERFLKWKKTLNYIPAGGDFRDIDKSMKGLFPKRK